MVPSPADLAAMQVPARWFQTLPTALVVLDLLQACPLLQVLGTSRSPSHIYPTLAPQMSTPLHSRCTPPPRAH
ncbi:MAG TPA: hypothetical protein VGP82_13725, partial [Ktedonobacterales bacterium]|nr:hypothetical protein [Ktedonobacterales bacterium]